MRPEARDRCTECGPENALIAGLTHFDCSPLQVAKRHRSDYTVAKGFIFSLPNCPFSTCHHHVRGTPARLERASCSEKRCPLRHDSSGALPPPDVDDT